MRRLDVKRYGCVAVLLAPVLLFAAVLALEYPIRLLQWQTLSKTEVVKGAEVFRRRYDLSARYLENAYVCLYVVSCESGRARLSPVTDIESWDFAATKATIWRRKFSDYCPGRTANFGLHWVDRSGAEIPGFLETAYWSMSNDRFLMRHGRFNTGAFSEEPWQRCTPDIAILKD